MLYDSSCLSVGDWLRSNTVSLDMVMTVGLDNYAIVYFLSYPPVLIRTARFTSSLTLFNSWRVRTFGSPCLFLL